MINDLDPWIVGPEDKVKHEKLFTSLKPVNGRLSGIKFIFQYKIYVVFFMYIISQILILELSMEEKLGVVYNSSIAKIDSDWFSTCEILLWE